MDIGPLLLRVISSLRLYHNNHGGDLRKDNEYRDEEDHCDHDNTRVYFTGGLGFRVQGLLLEFRG